MARRYLRGLTVEQKIHAIGWTVGERGCWNWNGRVGKGRDSGYGRVDDERQRQCEVHRVAFELWVRPLRPGEVVRHRCDNRRCLNPRHLQAGTQKDNIHDMLRRGRGAVLYPRGPGGRVQPVPGLVATGGSQP